MRQLLLAVLCVGVVLLQLALLPALRPFGIVPDLALPMVVLVGLEGTASLAMMSALGLGLSMDLAGGANFGLWTAILLSVALTTGLLRRAGFELSGPLAAVVMVAAGTIASAMGIWLALVGLVDHWPAGWLAGRLAGELIVNVLVVLAFRPIVRAVMRGRRASEVI